MGQKGQRDDVSSPGLLQRSDETAPVSDAQGDQNGILCELTVGRPMGHHVDQRLSGNKSLPLSVQHFCRNDVGEGPAHERATLARSLELIRGNREKELNKVAIQVRIPSLTQNLRRPDTGS